MSGIAPDEHLRAALRHAPDAELAAPAEIGLQIVAAAHREAATAPPAPPQARPAWWLRSPWSLGAGGALASLALVWALLPVAPPAPVPAAVDVVAAADPVTAPAPAPVLRERTAAADQVAPRAIVAAAPPVRAGKPEVRVEIVSQAPVAAAAPAAPAPVMTPGALAAATQDTSSAAPRGAVMAMRAAPRPEGPWMDALAAGTAVQWTVEGEARAPTSSWLYALAAQAQDKWQPGASAPAGRPQVTWQQNGIVSEVKSGRLWLGPQGATWCDAAGRCESAALAEDVARTLLRGLAR